MKYRSDDKTEEEIIWNSRDGLTPMVITMKSGKSGTHVDWFHDKCVPDYVPKPGERIFIDLTMEKALEYARRNIKRWEAEGLDMRTGPNNAIVLANDYMKHPGAPDIKIVE